MAEENKEKLLEVEEVRQKIAELKKKVGEMADYIKIDERRQKLAGLEEQQASGDFWNNQAKAKDVIAATNAERAYVVPFTSLTKTVEDAGVMLELAEMEEGPAQQTALKDTLGECAKADEFFGKLRLQSLLGGKFDQYNVFVSEVNGTTYARSAFVAAMTSLAFAWLFQKSPEACCSSSAASF